MNHLIFKRLSKALFQLFEMQMLTRRRFVRLGRFWQRQSEDLCFETAEAVEVVAISKLP